MQSKKGSLLEMGVNIGVKFGTSTALWYLIRPHALDIHPVCVTLIFTVNSFVFGYAIRRVFNKGIE